MTPIRYSHLKAIAQSPAHYLHRLSTQTDSTAAQTLGTAVHALVLGGPPVVCYEGAVRRGAAYDAFANGNDGAVILTRTDYERAHMMANAVRNNQHARDLLRDATHTEQRIEWDIGGRECAGTPDAFSPRFVLDLKTCQSSEPRKFGYDARRYHYAEQLAWYMNGIEACGEPRPTEAYIIAVESAAPYCVTVLRLTERQIDVATRTWRSWWERLMVCEASGEWPGYSQAIVDLDCADDEVSLDFGAESVEL